MHSPTHKSCLFEMIAITSCISFRLSDWLKGICCSWVGELAAIFRYLDSMPGWHLSKRHFPPWESLPNPGKGFTMVREDDPVQSAPAWWIFVRVLMLVAEPCKSIAWNMASSCVLHPTIQILIEETFVARLNQITKFGWYTQRQWIQKIRKKYIFLFSIN